MMVSVCLTVYNEEKSISALLDSLMAQSKKPAEIVIVDGGSTDETVNIIKHYQKKNKIIKLLIKKCSRAQGRNLSVEIANSSIIAITDADCIANVNWLKYLIAPFTQKEVGISAGFYLMTQDSYFQKAESVFLGVHPVDFDINFLPSTRSIAFRKSVWEEIGGFPESDNNSAEDTDFNYKAIKMGIKYARIKDATVEWGIPDSFAGFINKIYSYAKWDAKYGIWWHPTQGLSSHNIKVMLVFIRYIIGVFLFVISVINPPMFLLFLLCFLSYLLYSFFKVFLKTGSLIAGIWGLLLQIACDIAVMTGFISGIT